MFQGQKAYTPVVGENLKGRLPGPIRALKQGSVGDVMSDLQNMQAEEKKQHQQAYNYENGNMAY